MEVTTIPVVIEVTTIPVVMEVTAIPVVTGDFHCVRILRVLIGICK